MRPLAILLFGLGSLVSGCADHGRLLADETRLETTQLTLKLDSALETDDYFSELCFGLPKSSTIDVLGGEVRVDGEPAIFYAAVFAPDGSKLAFANLSALQNKHGLSACLSSLSIVRGSQLSRVDVWASRPVVVRDIRWFNTDKM